jgi:hypothetical protein
MKRQRTAIEYRAAVALLIALLMFMSTSARGQTPAEQPSEKSSEEAGRRLEIYGFVMADLGHDFSQNHADWFDVVRPTKLPSFPGEFGENSRTFFGVRQTRFGARAWLPSNWGEVQSTFEWELFGTGVDAGQTTLRLRHAYVQVGDLGVGQTWSPFMDADVFPNSIEYWGPTGMVFFRNLQLRWMPVQGNSRVTLALERPGASGDQGVLADRIELDNVRGRFPYPDISGEFRLGGGSGYVELAGILRFIEWDDLLLDDEFDLAGDALGWGVNLSSNLKFGPGKTSALRLQVVYGEGIENYMNDAPADIGVVFNPGDPSRPIDGEALPLLGLVGFIDYNWSPKWSTSLGYSSIDIDNSEGQSADAFRSGQYALLNLLHYPFESFMLGAEVQWGERKNFDDGFKTDTWRFQFSVRSNFSFMFGRDQGVVSR